MTRRILKATKPSQITEYEIRLLFEQSCFVDLFAIGLSITSLAELSDCFCRLHLARMFLPSVNNASALAINRALTRNAARKIARAPNYIAFQLIDRLSR
jgi:hypothetical protein